VLLLLLLLLLCYHPKKTKPNQTKKLVLAIKRLSANQKAEFSRFMASDWLEAV